MKKMQVSVVLIFLFISIVYMPSILSVGGGNDPGDNYPPWGGPMSPMCAFCDINGSWYWEGWEQVNPYLSDPIPDLYAWDEYVEITDKGVLTCINVTLPENCTANVTFQWLDWSLYFGLWMDWAYAQDWDDWPDGVDMDSEPYYDNNSFWFNYSSWNDVNQSTKLCSYAENVSCRTENNWASSSFDWRVTINVTCANYTFDETCYYCFEPELCPVSYIYPPSPNGTACPCCSQMCIKTENELGHAMNLVIYRNDTMNETFYVVNKYINSSNDTHCFCLDGHISDIYYPMRYNETYHWYVTITDVETNVTTNSSIFQFRTEENLSRCPCGLEAIKEATGRGEILRVGSLHDLSAIAFIFAIISLLIIIVIYTKRKKQEEDEETEEVINDGL